MKVKLMAHTQLSNDMMISLSDDMIKSVIKDEVTSGQVVSLSAIRTCYSANKPSEIVIKEGDKYFKQKATEGTGTEADRLIRLIMSSGHTSTLEHISFTFAIEGVSIALLKQLTRHRVGFSFSVQSQRYVKQSSDSRHGRFGYVVPEKMQDDEILVNTFNEMMRIAQDHYDILINHGVPQEDARAVLPNAATCNLVMTTNLTALLSFYSKRKPGAGAQKEITELAELLKEKVISVEPWTAELFNYKHVSKEEKILNKAKSMIDKNASIDEIIALLKGDK